MYYPGFSLGLEAKFVSGFSRIYIYLETANPEGVILL
jgi:hypothetical protein